MTFQAYLDNIKAKTGKTPADFKRLAEKKGFLKPGTKAGEIVAWLKDDFGLGRGHAMAIVHVLKSATAPKTTRPGRISKHFSGARQTWREPYDQLIDKLSKFGEDVRVSPTNTYLSLLRGQKKFGIVQVTAKRMDIGIKLKGAQPTKQFASSGTWSSMVTHRVQVEHPKDINAKVIAWLRRAYEQAG